MSNDDSPTALVTAERINQLVRKMHDTIGNASVLEVLAAGILFLKSARRWFEQNNIPQDVVDEFEKAVLDGSMAIPLKGSDEADTDLPTFPVAAPKNSGLN